LLGFDTMRELFPGFNHDPDYEKLWKECYFVLDTNVLLRLYEYPESTTDNILDFLEHEKIRERIWLPHQVALEYQKNRLKVIWKQENFYTVMINFLNEFINDISNLKKKFDKRSEILQSEHRYLNVSELFGNIDKEIDGFLASLKKLRNDIQTNKNRDLKLSDDDVIGGRLNELFGKHNIGESYSKYRLSKIFDESKFRYQNEIPPAYRDKKDGDLIIWFQIIDLAKKKKKPVIFVTDDIKEDWWFKKDNGDLLGPHPLLIQEFFDETKQIFHMYRPKIFLKYLEQYIEDLEMDPKTIRDVSTFKPTIMPINQFIMPDELLQKINSPLIVPTVDMTSVTAEMNRQWQELMGKIFAVNSIPFHVDMPDLSRINKLETMNYRQNSEKKEDDQKEE